MKRIFFISIISIFSVFFLGCQNEKQINQTVSLGITLPQFLVSAENAMTKFDPKFIFSGNTPQKTEMPGISMYISTFPARGNNVWAFVALSNAKDQSLLSVHIFYGGTDITNMDAYAAALIGTTMGILNPQEFLAFYNAGGELLDKADVSTDKQSSILLGKNRYHFKFHPEKKVWQFWVAPDSTDISLNPPVAQSLIKGNKLIAQ